jgi:hypothetical protein
MDQKQLCDVILIEAPTGAESKDLLFALTVFVLSVRNNLP